MSTSEHDALIRKDPPPYQQGVPRGSPYDAQPPSYQAPPGAQSVNRVEYRAVDIDNGMIWSILACLFCAWPCGLVAICKSAEVNEHVVTGEFEAAQMVADSANKWRIASLVCGILSLLSSATYAIIYLVVLKDNQDDPY